MTNDIRKVIQSANSIALFGHESPDGDAIGSVLALTHFLTQTGKQVTGFLPDQPADSFKFLPGYHSIQTEFNYGNYDLLIFLDFSEYGRISRFTQNNTIIPAQAGTSTADPLAYFYETPTLIIDHHPQDPRPEQQEQATNLTIHKDKTAASNCERLRENMLARNSSFINTSIATCCLTGHITDTGNFFFDIDSHRAYTNAAQMMAHDADKNAIITNLFRSQSAHTLSFVGLILGRVTNYQGILYTWYDSDELARHHCDKSDVDYVTFLIQNVIGHAVTCLFKIYPDCIKCSLRSRSAQQQKPGIPIIDVGKLAQICFQGGGHARAAGCKVTYQGDPQDKIQEMLQAIQQYSDTTI